MVSRLYPQSLSFSDFSSLCRFHVVMLVTSFQDFKDSIRFDSDIAIKSNDNRVEKAAQFSVPRNV